MTPVETLIADDLSGVLDGEVLTDELARAMYSTAAGVYEIVPLAIVRPRDRGDIAKTLQWCAEHDVPLTVRGGGTSPVDGCLGRGVILDMAAHFGSPSRIDVHGDFITAPAGVPYVCLNQALAPFGRYLPPDPVAGDYRTIGGMIATNAAGITSLKYGGIIDYVESLELMLDDGTVVETRPLDVRKNEFKDLVAGTGREAQLTNALYNLIRDNRSLIRSRMPNLPVNSSGYRLDRAQYRGVLDLGQLVTGSEGTLAVITGAKLATAEPLPVSGVLVLYFETLQLAVDSVRPLLDHGPCSLDLIDGRALEHVRRARPDLGHFCRDRVRSVLVAEFDGSDNDEVIPKLMEAEHLLVEEGGTAVDAIAATAEPDVEEARAFRKVALNLLQSIREHCRVTPFIEDVAVEPDSVSSLARGLTEVLGRRGLEVAVSGHVGHGNLSARPLLDLKNDAGLNTMREAANEVFEMISEMGGTISSGHGDGLARSEFLRIQYGDLCDVFGQVKRIFDPNGRLSPGIKVGAERGTIVSNLRYGPSYSRRPIQPKLLYPDEPRGDVIERCDGCGACRSLTDLVTMCPVYKVLQTEEASPRAKANILRHVLSNRGTLPPEDELIGDMARLTDLCLACRMCSVECPAGIDVAKLMVELRARRAEKGGLGLDEKLARQWDRILCCLGTFPLLSNFLLRRRTLRLLSEKLLGFSAQRRLPTIRVRNLSGRHPPTLTNTRQQVVYVTGLMTDCTKPDVVECARDVLTRNGIEVRIVSELALGKTRLLYGDVAGARKQVEKALKRIEPFVEEGQRVVFTEPSAALFFKREMLDCIDTPAARAVSAASFDLMQFLLSLYRAGRLDTRFRALTIPMAYHPPCQLRAMQIGTPALELLRLIPEFPVAGLAGGCCGMAGTFGLLEKHYELSMRIGRPLFDELRNLDVKYGLSDCSYCAMQLEQGSGKKILHPIQVLHRAYGLPRVGSIDW